MLSLSDITRNCLLKQVIRQYWAPLAPVCNESLAELTRIRHDRIFIVFFVGILKTCYQLGVFIL